MGETFGAEFAQQYDLLHEDKNYDAETALLERLLASHGVKSGSVLDLGCGTGQHAIRLARAGYEVTGVDRSQQMLSIARVKAEQSLDETSPMPSFVEGDVTSVRLGGAPFDAALMFGTFGFQVSNAAVRSALKTVRAHLRTGALFVCDIWYGPAVLHQRPGERTKVVPTADGQVVRTATATLDSFAHRADITYRVQRLRGNDVIADLREVHVIRFFFPQELALLFEEAGLELLELRAFGDADQRPSESTWKVLAVGRVT